MSGAEQKTLRVLTALDRKPPDRVPVGEFFWSNFVKRAKQELAGGGDFNPYSYWDLDLIVVNPNMDPHITGIQVVEQTGERTVVKTGFGSTIESRATCPMPYFLEFETETYEEMARFGFDDAKDERRYFEAIDDQLNSVGDTINLGVPSFVDRVNACAKDFCVFGGVCEPHELIWRIIGSENLLLKLGEDPEQVARFAARAGDFLVGIVEGQVAAAKGKLSGLYIWGDIAYDRGMLFSPDLWRWVYKPQVKRLCDAAKAAGLKIIYHGCGNASAVFEDLIDIGVDAYNPIEAKSGLDVVALKRRYGRRWAFNGNIDVRVLATNDRELIRREVLTKLNAAKGGGYIVQSDHSVPDDVAPSSYDYVVGLVREYGKYPLELGEFDQEFEI